MATNATAHKKSAPAAKPPVVSGDAASTIISLETCVSNINKAMTSRRLALQIELSVGLSVFAMHGSTSKEARDMLNQIYVNAGWRSADPRGLDYKTVNRRINATASLFDKLGAEEINNAIGNNKEQRAINAIAKHLEHYKLLTVNDVFAFAGKPVKVKEHKRTPPAANPPQPKEARRRWSDEERANVKRIDLGPIHWVIPPETRRKDLLEAARRLLELADEFNNGDHADRKPVAVH